MQKKKKKFFSLALPSTPQPEPTTQPPPFHRSFSQPAETTDTDETSIWGNPANPGNFVTLHFLSFFFFFFFFPHGKIQTLSVAI